jgi:hypothetical protein
VRELSAVVDNIYVAESTEYGEDLLAFKFSVDLRGQK